MLVRTISEKLLGDVSAIEGVEYVESFAGNTFQKLTISVTVGADVKDQAAEIIGGDNIESLVLRDPTLEEAYISILR